MSKEYSKSVARAMKCLHAIMQYMKKNGGSIRFRDIMDVYASIEENRVLGYE